MASYTYDGSATYTGTDGDDQFYMQDETKSVTIQANGGVDYVRGGNYADLIYGGDGTDYLYGGGGNDTVYGGAGNDVISGAIDNGDGTVSTDYGWGTGPFSNESYANGGVPDLLYGGEGNDTIYVNDGSGDVAYGGPGDDTYIVKYSIGSTSEVIGESPYIYEQPNEGTDTLIVSGGLDDRTASSPGGEAPPLPDNCENLILADGVPDPSAHGTGNGLDNIIIGNSIPNILSGLAGNDLIGDGDGGDTLLGGDGNDTLYGGSGNDSLDGGNGNDVLFGDAGSDTMVGGPGDDLYSVTDPGDIVTEKAGEGYDEVYSSVTYGLPENVETLFLTGDAVYATGNSTNDALIGNDQDNIITAGSGSFNFLNGGAGNDLLIGGPGHDEMMGGSGNDLFRFSSPDTTPDFIYDLISGQDKVELNAAAFGMDHVVDGATFISSDAPQPVEAGPTIEYNNQNGDLFYDPDGTGSQAPTFLALLNGVPDLKASDITFY